MPKRVAIIRCSATLGGEEWLKPLSVQTGEGGECTLTLKNAIKKPNEEPEDVIFTFHFVVNEGQAADA